MSARDALHRFLFEQLAVRGELVHLDVSWRAVLERRIYPPAVQQLLGEAVAAAVLLSATIKFDGVLTLQIQANGPIQLLVAQISSERTLRALARWEGEPASAPLNELCRDGVLMLSIDSSQKREPYQGVVSLQGKTLAAALTEYFVQSEQLPTQIHLIADQQSAAGLLLQRLPDAVASDTDGWNRLQTLAATVQPTELLQLDAPTLLRRLFHEEDVRLFKPSDFSYRCTCSRERTAAMLQALGENELHQILVEQGIVHVDCEFCGYRYQFDRIDIAGVCAGFALNPSAVRH
jgi:molecular chaperone Hsp33